MSKLFIPVKAKGKKVDEVLKLEEFFIKRKFGKTTHYLLVDSEKDNFVLLVNSNHHYGGNKSSAEIAQENGAEVVIAAHMGKGAYDKIKERQIEILRGELNTPLPQIIEKFKQDELEEFDEPKPHDDDDSHHNH